MRWHFSSALVLFVGLIFAANLFVPQPARSQSATVLHGPFPVAKLFPTLPISKWVGQRVQFLAAPIPIAGDLHGTPLNIFGWMRVKTAAEIEKETYRHGDVVEGVELTPNISDPNYVKAMRQELDGKIATVVKVEKVRDGAATETVVTVEADLSKRRYTYTAYQDTIDNVVFLGDLNAARGLFKGKTLYCREQDMLAFHGHEIVRVPVGNVAPVVVQDVVPATDENAPLRFLLQTRDGKHVFADVHVSDTNTATSLRQYDRFTTTFFVSDPHKVRRLKTKKGRRS